MIMLVAKAAFNIDAIPRHILKNKNIQMLKGKFFNKYLIDTKNDLKKLSSFDTNIIG